MKEFIIDIKSGRRNKLLVFFMLFLVVIAFGLSLIERLPNLGELMANDCRLTFDTSTFLYNWLDLGIFEINGRMYMAPSSIETPGGSQLYTSYPPGFMIVPYILCLITGNEGTVSLVQSWNLANHLLLALTMSLIIFFIYKKTKFKNLWLAAVIGAISGIITVFIPGLYYYMEFEYFADTAALFPMAALILTEILLEGEQGKRKKILYWLQAFFIFAAAFTDFICYFLIFVIWVVRIIRGKYKSFKDFVYGTLKYVWPMLLAITLFGLYLYWAAGGLSTFLERYSQRSSFELNLLWVKKIGYWMYSLMGLKLIILVTASTGLYFLLALWGIIKRKKDSDTGKLVGWGAIAVIPMIMVTVVLSEHAYYHDFTMLRFVFPLVILSFAVCPLLIYKLFILKKNISEEKSAKRGFVFGVVVAVIAAVFSVIAIAERDIYLEPRLSYMFDFEPQKFLYEYAEYEDFVYITPEQLDSSYPPVYSRKPMHSMSNVDSIATRVSKLSDDANVCVLYVKNPEKPQTETTDELFAIMDEMNLVYSDDDYDFYRCTKDEFLEIMFSLGYTLSE